MLLYHSPKTLKPRSKGRSAHAQVRTSSFAFIASLPDETKDYLMKLKATAASASQTQQETSPEHISDPCCADSRLGGQHYCFQGRSLEKKTKFATGAYHWPRNDIHKDRSWLLSTPEKRGVLHVFFKCWGLRHGGVAFEIDWWSSSCCKPVSPHYAFDPTKAASDPTEVVSQALGRHLQAQEEPAAA